MLRFHLKPTETFFYNSCKQCFICIILFFSLLLSAADIAATLDSSDGSGAFVFKDSGSNTICSIDSDGNFQIRGGMRLDSSGAECTTSEMLIVDGSAGIGTVPASCAVFHLSSTSRGMLFPSMTEAQRNAISSPADGLTVFNTDKGTLDIYSTSSGGYWKQGMDALKWLGRGTSGDYNTIIQNTPGGCFWMDGPGSVNGPTGTNSGALLHFDPLYYNAGTRNLYSVQFADNGNGGDLYYRSMYNGTWSNWCLLNNRWKYSYPDVYYSSGEVGIGTSSPDSLFHVASAGQTEITVSGNGLGYHEGSIVFKGSNSSARGLGVFMHNSADSTEWFAGKPYNNADAYVISRKAAASHDAGTCQVSNALLTVNSSGYLGIHTDNPLAYLNISAGSTELIRLSGPSSGSYAGIGYYEGSSARFFGYLAESADRYYFMDADYSNGVYMDQNSSGWTAYSDRRMKKDITPLTVLDRIDDFQAVSFRWKDSGTYDIGAVAQDIAEIFPEIVDFGSTEEAEIKAGEPGCWGIHYDKTGILALQAVKELKQKLLKLEQENRELRDKIELLSDKIRDH